MKILIFFLYSFSALAVIPHEFKCQQQLHILSQEWKSDDDWTKEFQNGQEKYFYKTPTDKVGEWILLQTIEDGAVISKADQRGRIEVSFKGKSCEKKIQSYPHAKEKETLLTDEDLKKFVESKERGAIYVWSPRMPLSQKGLVEVEKASAKMNLPLLILLDKNIPEPEYKMLLAKLGAEKVRRMNSFELKMRSSELHFPALIVFKDKKILSGVKYGYEKADRYQLDLARMLK